MVQGSVRKGKEETRGQPQCWGMLKKSLFCPELKDSTRCSKGTVPTLPSLRARKLTAGKGFSRFIKVPQTSWLDQAGAGDGSSQSWIPPRAINATEQWSYSCGPRATDGPAAGKWSAEPHFCYTKFSLKVWWIRCMVGLVKSWGLTTHIDIAGKEKKKITHTSEPLLAEVNQNSLQSAPAIKKFHQISKDKIFGAFGVKQRDRN